MSYTEVEQVGFFEKLRSAIGGVVFGIILFLLAFPLLWWNEGRAVREATGIAAGQKAVHTVSADKVDPANEGKLIHVNGDATVTGSIKDDYSGLQAKALRLRRSVEIFQWEEDVKTETRKKLGGGEERVKTYTYKKDWVDGPINSSEFKEKGHNNTGSLPCDNASFNAAEAHLGAFEMGDAVQRLSNFQAFAVPSDGDPFTGSGLPNGARVEGGKLYIGASPSNPQIGDVRISYEVVPPGPVTVVAAQKGNSFGGFMAAQKEIFEVRAGKMTSDQIFADLTASNNMITWVLRVVGFFMMVIGISLLFGPIAALANIVPFLGSFVEGGAFLLAMLVAFPCTFFTIGLAWVAHRPLVGIAALMVGGAAVFFFGKKIRKKS